MKNRSNGALCVLALICFAGNFARAQAPASIAGKAFALAVVNGTSPFSGSGYGLLLPASSGSNYALLNISGFTGSSGSATYQASNTNGFVTANDGVFGSLSNTFIFRGPSAGTYSFVQKSSGAFQNGNFTMYAGQAPVSLSGRAYVCTIIANRGRGSSAGNFTYAFTASGYSLIKNGATNTGTYTYTNVNTGTGRILATPTGSAKTTGVFFSFSDPSGGGFAWTNSTGGYEVGTFTIPDTTPPTNRITAPTPGLQVSNINYTVTGAASDNVAVSSVFYSLNSAGWNKAATGNKWTNWTAAVTLSPGTNTIAAYAVDSSNNLSTTNTVKFVYIPSATLTVRTNGLGSLNPNDNGALLQIGKSFFITATAASGFMFTNWTGGTNLSLSVLTNGPTIQFQMKSNLMLQANFVDVTKPTLSITNVTAGMNVSNAAFTLKGNAGDNVAVSNVYYSLNNTGWNNAVTGNKWTNWSAAVVLSPGTNTIAAYAVDATGNQSITNSASLVYILSATLTVRTNGLGSLNPNDNGALLQIGKSYSITAMAASGFMFTNWTGGTNLPAGVLTNGTTVTFLMVTNLMLQANFVDVTRPTLSITNVTAGMNVSNASFTVKGKAGDNVAVSNVFYSLNNTGWNNAATGNNWTNWSAALTLTPGTNTIAAYAVDTTGNKSTTNTLNFFYVVNALLTVSTNGLGSLNPNDNGALLQIGKGYSITATAASGFMFTNWTGGTNLPLRVLTNKTAVTFLMATNLRLQANFVDVTRPTLSITNVTAGMDISNASFTVKGKAGDNVAVSNVFYSLNNAGWNNAATGNNWTNWSAALMLTPGTNTVAAYAVDTTGNKSTTNTLNFFYVVNALLTVSTNGLGSLNPNDNGALLQIGKGYSITATAASGFMFTNWTGGTNLPLRVLTNKTAVTFLMATNLRLQANFVDVSRPTLTISSPTSGQRWSNAVFTVSGKASDNWQVSSVQYQLNGSGWASAAGTTNWSASVNLTPGTNSVQAYAVDNTGNKSTTNSVNFDFVVTNRLQVSATGLGSISPNYSNAWLEIGRNYSLTAAPASGFIFTNWVIFTNGIGGVKTNSPTVQFQMKSFLLLQVNFVDVAKPTVTITAPASGQHLTNALANVAGTAGDNWKVAGVWYSLNGGDWSQPATTNNWTNWTTSVELQAATNTLKAYALDLAGNFSATNTVSFVSSNAFLLQLAWPPLQPMATNDLKFVLQVSPGLNGHIQVSSNLVDWVTLTNFVGSNTTLNFHDPAATNFNNRFYRAVVP